LEVLGIVGTALYCLPKAPITAHTDSIKYDVIANASPDQTLSPGRHLPFFLIACSQREAFAFFSNCFSGAGFASGLGFSRPSA